MDPHASFSEIGAKYEPHGSQLAARLAGARRHAFALRIDFPLTSLRPLRSCPAEHERYELKSAELDRVRALVLISLDSVLDAGPESVLKIGHHPSSEYVRPLGFEPRTCGLRVRSRSSNAYTVVS